MKRVETLSKFFRRAGRTLAVVLSLVHLTAVVASPQANTPSPAITTQRSDRAPYLVVGDSVEKKYDTHRAQLEQFFNGLVAVLDKEAPELREKLQPPAPVPFGYQILPPLLDNPPWSAPQRILFSRFSWSRTDTVVDRGRAQLATVKARFEKAAAMDSAQQRHEYEQIVDEYKRMLATQKLMANLIQYNRLWQGDVVRRPQVYRDAKLLQNAAVERQRLLDSLALPGQPRIENMRARADSLSRSLDAAIAKAPPPDFMRLDHPADHRWVITVPVLTDITDSAFIARAQSIIQAAWHLRDGNDDFTVLLDIRRLSASELYPKGDAPEKGAHIDIGAHTDRFPQGGMILTTGGNLTYAYGRAIILGPHAIFARVLAHEFGHMLGFKDGYFRSFEDLGPNGYEIVEVILVPGDVVAAPEGGVARREHFDQLLREKHQ